MQIEINRSTLSLAREGRVAIRGQDTGIVCHAGSRVDAANRTERFRTHPACA
jgi:hypothetical protein